MPNMFRKKNFVLHSFRAFTAIELAVVIVIMVILAAAGSINSMKGYDTMKLDAAARKVASDIRYAQSLAINNFNNLNIVGTVVDFNPGDANRYTITNNGGLNTIVDFDSGEYTGVEIIGLGGFISSQGSTSKIMFGLGDTDRIFLDPAPYLARPHNGINGSDWDDSLLTTQGSITLRYKGKTRSITVEPETGLVEIQ